MMSLRSVSRIPSLNAKASLARIALGAALAAVGTLACVTVNVNFPEGVVQKATDDFVRDLYRAKTTGSDPSRKRPASSEGGETSSLFRRLGDALFPVAHADEAFRVSTPGAEAIKARLRGRLADVIKFKKQGLIGETSDGRLVVRPDGESKKLLAPKLKELVDGENRDRAALYDEVMSANQLDGARRVMVERSFANSFQAESPSGTWVQGADGTWARKR